MKLAWGADQHVEVTWTKADEPDAPVVIIWPAFGTPATFYRHLSPSLRQAGCSTLVVEYPGRESPQGVGSHTDYGYDILATTVHSAVMTQVREEHPDSLVVVLGHSLGGHVGLLATAAAHAQGRSADVPDGLVLAATASPYWRGYGRWGFPRSVLGTGFMAGVARSVGYWPGDRLRFWGRQSRVLVEDWARFARTGRVQPQGACLDYSAALAAYPGQVLAVSLPDDSFAPVAALDNLLRFVPNAQVRRWHAVHPVGHIQWVRQHEEVLPVVVEWIEERRARRE